MTAMRWRHWKSPECSGHTPAMGERERHFGILFLVVVALFLIGLYMGFG
jgi:hypothetical protein